MRVRRVTATVGCAIAVAATSLSPVHAHHSPAAYDLRSTRSVEGTVTEFDWGNPHVYLSVREAGGDRVWVVEAFPSTAMKQYGWSASTFVPGDRVIVVGNPGRSEARTVLLLRSVRKAGAAAAVYDAGGAVAPAPPPPPEKFRATGLSGTWGTVVGPSFPRFFGDAVADLGSPKGAAAVAGFRDETANPGLDCVPFTAPVYMILPGFRSIERRGETVLIRGEDAAVERIVHLDATTHEGAAPSVQGHSIGRFEGGVLLVDTTRFAPHRLGNGAGLPSGAEKRLVERFELNAEGGLTYRFELHDPEYLRQSVTGSAEWLYRPDVEYAATPCTRDNARRFLGE